MVTIIGGISIILTLIICFYISQKLTKTLEKLTRATGKITINRVLSEETRAKLQAIQSLINPHFLYNSLTNISIMAEEEMNEDIVKLCGALCNYFRYISSVQEMIVPLEREIFYTEQYLKCMKFRFGDELAYKFSIAQETESFFIPKLLIQPIIENAFKYAFCISPPWHLIIRSYTQNQLWLLEIEDNGGTMSNEKKQELMNLYENLNMNKE